MKNYRGLLAAALTLNLILAFFLLGSASIESFLNYPLWRDLGQYLRDPRDFGPWRAAHFPAIVLTLPLPRLLHMIITAALAWRLRKSVIRNPLFISLAALVCAWALGAIVIIPMQFELDQAGYSRGLIERIIRWDYLRTAAGLVNVACWARVLAQFVSGHARIEAL